MNTTIASTFSANGRIYKTPSVPTVVVCIDGCEPDYLTQAVFGGHMPWMQQTLASGFGLSADCVIPSFTNPNNLSIVTGVPPNVHGICGNYFFDTSSGRELMMNEPQWLRCPTLLSAASTIGLKVAVVTAKDKLRALLGHGMQGICFSAECADSTDLSAYGIGNVVEFVGLPTPDVYSAALSEFVLAAGLGLMQTRRPDLMYLSTTDYVQHKHAPGTTEANRFYAMMDSYLARLDGLGCVIAITADHGMPSKAGMDTAPLVLYLQDWLKTFLKRDDARVVLPITDPYVVHHGALGSFATIYLPAGTSPEMVCSALQNTPGVELALPREVAAERFELPPDRIGDVVVVSDRFHVIGKSPEAHDLTGLDAPLRSHGGLGEQRVPLIVNHPATQLDPTRRLRNFDVFDVALNFAQYANGSGRSWDALLNYICVIKSLYQGHHGIRGHFSNRNGLHSFLRCQTHEL